MKIVAVNFKIDLPSVNGDDPNITYGVSFAVNIEIENALITGALDGNDENKKDDARALVEFIARQTVAEKLQLDVDWSSLREGVK